MGLGVAAGVTGETVGPNTGVTLGVTAILSGNVSVTPCLKPTLFPTPGALCVPVKKREYQRAKAANTIMTRTIQIQVRANIRVDV
jgi:hypothetical protein